MISLQQEDTIRETVKKFEPSLVGIFGSYARNEHNNTSDLDILIDFEKNVNLLDLIGLEQELSELLGIKVDLVTVRSVNQKLNSNIQRDLIRIV
ncbi:MAG: nucleotidyltransferase family protein [Saprospiraceae bacterium]|jgi:predicted nucleotidyltransferase|nr:nucleotidyltransferase family protein [Candidatus Brachybacter algidus]MBK8748462.1 nucleotidyltransferase family protein [Candidatus Brachybacter algidus]